MVFSTSTRSAVYLERHSLHQIALWTGEDAGRDISYWMLPQTLLGSRSLSISPQVPGSWKELESGTHLVCKAACHQGRDRAGCSAHRARNPFTSCPLGQQPGRKNRISGKEWILSTRGEFPAGGSSVHAPSCPSSQLWDLS